MSDEFRPTRRSWLRTFGDALRGIRVGVRGQHNFRVHFVFVLLVVAAAAVLKVSRLEWCLLILCMTIVLSAEMMNSALEVLAKAIDRRHNQHIADGLDIASAAVLLAAIGAAIVGVLVLLVHLGPWLGFEPNCCPLLSKAQQLALVTDRQKRFKGIGRGLFHLR